MAESLVGGSMFKDVIVDDRVTKDLDHCIYCSVYNSRTNTTLTYKIPLIKLRDMFKQCPACNAIYILKDPTE